MWKRKSSRLELAYQKLAASRNSCKYRADFKQVETFCLFIGHPRSGHSLVGALIDAHPEAIVAHELDALSCIDQRFNRRQLWTLILQNSLKNKAGGRRDALSAYPYDVANQYQGRYTRLRVIGDKKGGLTTRRLAARPALLEELLKMHVGLSVAFIHIIRNPFDNIATMVRRNGLPLADNVDIYFQRCRTIMDLHQRPEMRILDHKYEDIVLDPLTSLRKICAFLDLEASESYLQDCAKIVYPKPKRTWGQLDWPPEIKKRVADGARIFPFLREYSLGARSDLYEE